MEIKYHVKNLNRSECAKYVRIVAGRKSTFGKKYVPGNAWDMMYDNRVVCDLEKEGKTLHDLWREAEFEPGQLVVFYYPDSDYLKGKDKRGNDKIGTHIALYIGKENWANGSDFTFVHQIIEDQEKASLEKIMNEYKMAPRVVLDEPNSL